MDTLKMYKDMEDKGVCFYTWELGDIPAAAIETDNQAAVFMDFDNISTEAEERVVLSHEKGHIDTGGTHPISSPYDLIAKHEYQAWKDAILTLIPQKDLNAAIKDGYTDIWTLAEHFNVTKPFMQMTFDYYNEGHLTISDDLKKIGAAH